MNEDPVDIVFYNDVDLFGGHEVMLLVALRALLETGSTSVAVIYSRSNKMLEAQLASLGVEYPALRLLPQYYTSGRLQIIRSLLSFRAVHQISSLMAQLSPKCVVVVQGDITLSSVGLLAAKRAGLFAISYLPMAHTRKLRGERLAVIKDAILRYYYQLPGKYITISNAVSMQLNAHGVSRPVDIVENGIELADLPAESKSEARAALGLDDDVYVAAICGRIEFKQKGHDVLLEALAHRVSAFKKWRILIVGDGPDRRPVERLIVEKGLSDIVRVVPWQSSMSGVYSAIDMIVMPSNFEGVPVVMLEAMYYRLPLVGSKIDALDEFVPVDWLVPPGDHRLLSEKMLQMSSMELGQQLDRNKEMVVSKFSVARQKIGFRKVFANCMAGPDIN